MAIGSVFNAPPVIARGNIPADGTMERVMWERFGCNTLVAAPVTPHEVAPDIAIERDVYHGFDIAMPDGNLIEIWGFMDPNGLEQFPSEIMRFTEGQIVHSTIFPSHGPHTIHHHGIEPETFNDGVGHISFEVDGAYTYQFRAEAAGTYLYHCHRNTTLHFEMGMYGPLVIDPPEGQGTLFAGGPTYDHERIWAVDEIDSRWHTLDKAAGIECDFYTGDNPRLNEFNPDYFVVSGVPAPDPSAPLNGEANRITDPNVAVEAETGETILLRIMNAGYTTQRFSFPGLTPIVAGVDGRQLGMTGPATNAVAAMGKYSSPFTLHNGRPFYLTTAQRWDLLITPKLPGTYYGKIECLDWTSGQVLSEMQVAITVTGSSVVKPMPAINKLLLGS